MHPAAVKGSITDEKWAGRLRSLSIAFGVLVALIGAGHLLAWFSGSMIGRGGSSVTMKTNTALALLFEGLALVLLASPQAELARRWAGRGLAALAALLGLLSLSENLLGWDLGIDQLLAQEPPGALGVGAPNLMGTPASTSFILAGLALLILSRRGDRGAKAMQGLALAAFLTALMGAIGYLYGVQSFYIIARLTGIAWPTAMALLMLSLGLLLVRPTQGLMKQVMASDPGGANLRRWLSVLLMPVALGWIRLTGERMGLFDAATGTSMMMIIFIVALAVLAYTGARPVSQSSAELQRQREWLRVTLSSIGDAVIATDTAGKITFLNPVAEGLTGWKEQEILAHPVREVFRIINAQTRQPADDIVQRVLLEGRAVALANHTALIAKDGRQIPIEDSAAPIKDRDGNISGVVLVFHDVTEKRRAHEALREANEQLELRVRERTAELTEALQALRRTGAYTRSLIESSLDPLVAIGRDGSITDVNAAAETATGRVRQELIGADFSTCFTEPENARLGYQLVFKEGSVRDYALEIRHRDGHTIPVLYNAAVYKDEAGQVAGIFAAARDITERNLAEEALRRSEQEFRALTEAVPQIVWATRPDGWNVYFNQKWVDYTGLTLEESYGHGWNTPFHADDRQRAWEAWKHATQDEAPYSLECRLRRADGIYRWWLIRGEPMRGANGEILKWFGTCTDIEDLRHASEQLRRITSELMVTEQRERQRLAQVLHDGLQQILVGAKFRLALLERGKDIRQTTSQIGELIDDAIETSRSLSVELSPPILLQGDFMAALEWLVRWMHDKHGIEVNITAYSRIAHLQEDAILLLFQAARELLFNVVKHAGVKNADIEVNRLDGHISMTVEDKGAGFDQNILAHRGGQSSGTGLFGIRERLSYIGGRIEIDSAPGRGSRFRLIVPVPEANAEANRGTLEKKAHVSAAVSAQIDSTPAGVERKIRVALVDDHIVVRQGLAGLLRAEPGIEIIGEASDGQSAIDLIRNRKPDVVLMDINMSGMDGIEATRIITREIPEVRIIGLSMFQAGEQEAAMREAGAVDYVTKSGPAEEMIQAIRNCVRT